MHQLGFHLTPNHLMQYIKAKAIKICKTQGRFKCIRGLPWLTEKSGSVDVPQLSNPTSTDGLTSSSTWLTTTCSLSFTTRSNNAMFNMMRDIKHDAWWWIQQLITGIQLSFAVQLQANNYLNHFVNSNNYFKYQESSYANDPRSSLNPKFKQNLSY